MEKDVIEDLMLGNTEDVDVEPEAIDSTSHADSPNVPGTSERLM